MGSTSTFDMLADQEPGLLPVKPGVAQLTKQIAKNKEDN